MEAAIEVSVFCTVYNHEKYLRKCLDGFVMQKTNFAFEVLINDDKSTDSSAEIIKEYYEKYPDIFVPVFQTENQYSKGIEICDDILLPMARGKYIAICEGDDYWCDENKLQLQYDYMESDKDCVMCVHNSIFHYVECRFMDRLFNNWKKIHIMSGNEVFNDYKVHTSSYFMRKEYWKKPDYGKKCFDGDYVRLTYLYTIGKISVLPQVMSVYNYGVFASATYLSLRNDEKRKKCMLDRINYLEKLNIDTGRRFAVDIEKQISLQKFLVFSLEKEDILQNCKNRKKVIAAAREVVSHEHYMDFVKSKHGFIRLCVIFKYEGYVIYPIWRLAYKIYYGRKEKNK